MTTLVGLQGKNFAVLAADSQITEDNLRTISLTTPKIIRKGKYLLGITGDTRPGDILTYNWNPPALPKNVDAVQHMGKKVIPSIIDAFSSNGYHNYGGDDKEGGFDYLLAFNAQLFHIACDLSFIQSHTGYYGIGSGGQFATGYLWGKIESAANLTKKNACEIADMAIRCAEQFDINTGLPVQIVVQERG